MVDTPLVAIAAGRSCVGGGAKQIQIFFADQVDLADSIRDLLLGSTWLRYQITPCERNALVCYWG